MVKQIQIFLSTFFIRQLKNSFQNFSVFNNLQEEMFHVKHFLFYAIYRFTRLFFIANTAACVRSETSIFLNMFDT